MTTERERFYRGLFWVAAAYDLVLGFIFLFFSRPAADLLGFEDELPAFDGYVSLLAAFVFVIGIAYAFVAMGDLVRNRDLIAVGAIYKLAYATVAAYYLAVGEYPHLIFVVGFGGADLVFMVLMAECWWYLHRLETGVVALQPQT